jgi:hypothetical protein
MVTSGIESVVAEYGVRVGNDRILAIGHRPATAVQALTNPNNVPVGRAFNSDDQPEIFLFNNVRTIEAGNTNPQGGSPYTVDSLMLVPAVQGIWRETDLARDPSTLAAELRKPENRNKLAETLSRADLSIAVTVKTSRGGMPRIPGHEGLMKEQPRMVVFGDADWVTDQYINGQLGGLYYDLFTSCLAWLRERSDIGTSANAEVKQRKAYKLNVPEANLGRLRYLPLGLSLLGVLALGCGVWVVRRR